MLLDTYAWIEYWKGTPKGKKVEGFLVESQCYTSSLSLAELSEWVEKENRGREEIFETVKGDSIVLVASDSILEQAGILKVQKRKTVKDMGMVDCIILATARAYGLPIVTGDRHFAQENAVML